MTQMDKEIHQYFWIGRISTMKITVLPKAIYTFNSILIELSMAFFTQQ